MEPKWKKKSLSINEHHTPLFLLDTPELWCTGSYPFILLVMLPAEDIRGGLLLSNSRIDELIEFQDLDVGLE